MVVWLMVPSEAYARVMDWCREGLLRQRCIIQHMVACSVVWEVVCMVACSVW